MRLLRTFALPAALALTLPVHLAAQQQWVGTWATSPFQFPAKLSKTITFGETELTVRQVVHISQGGKSLRITFTNEFGATPLTLSSVKLAFLAANDRILPATLKPITFSGKSDVTIPAGQFLASDPVTLTLPIFSDLVISAVVPQQPLTTISEHSLSMSTSYIVTGDHAAEEQLDAPTKVQHWFFLKDIQVNAEKHSAAIVTLGDSITDGARSTPDTNRRWPDVLAPRLAADKHTKSLAVLNEGISGNRVLHFGTGPSVLDRLDRDVLAAPGAKYVILMEAINDIGRTKLQLAPEDTVTADQIIAGYKQIIDRCHAKGLKIFGATLTPYLPTGYSSPEGEVMRQAVNSFIRTPGNFDGVIDFEKVIEDPKNPGHMLPKYDPGDHLHPNDLGYAAMGAAINLKLFRSK